MPVFCGIYFHNRQGINFIKAHEINQSMRVGPFRNLGRALGKETTTQSKNLILHKPFSLEAKRKSHQCRPIHAMLCEGGRTNEERETTRTYKISLKI